MDERNKWAFWTFVVVAAALVSVPSTLLLQALARYRRLTSGIEPGALRPVTVHFVPHEGSARASLDEPRLDFVDFQLKAPKAKKVELIGDFNQWKKGTLALARRSGGAWDLLLPLPKGRYRYLFVVDGQTSLDPRCRQMEQDDGRQACLKEVR